METKCKFKAKTVLNTGVDDEYNLHPVKANQP